MKRILCGQVKLAVILNKKNYFANEGTETGT